MQYFAFLRAINVGRHNRIKMDDLRALCAGAGFEGVRTYLQSGNLVLEGPAASGDTVAARIEEALVAHGLRGAEAMVRSRPEIEELLAGDHFAPWPSGYTRLVTFLRQPSPANAALSFPAGAELAALREREVLTALLEAPPPRADVNALIAKQLATAATTRYWHVVRDLAAFGDAK